MKRIVGILAFGLLISSPASSAFADTLAKGGFSAPHKATAAEIVENNKNSKEITPSTGYEIKFPSNGTTNPSLVSPNWSYTSLFPGSYIDTQAIYGVLTEGEQVVVQVVQYPMQGIFGTGYTAVAGYQLIAQGSGNNTPTYTLTGNYTSSNISFSFYNVTKGQYKLRIWNKTTGDNKIDLEGNGYVYYY